MQRLRMRCAGRRLPQTSRSINLTSQRAITFCSLTQGYTKDNATMTRTKEAVKSSCLNIWSSEAAAEPTPVVNIIAVQGIGAHPFYNVGEEGADKKVLTPNDIESKSFKDKAQIWKGRKPRGKDSEDSSCVDRT